MFTTFGKTPLCTQYSAGIQRWTWSTWRRVLPIFPRTTWLVKLRTAGQGRWHKYLTSATRGLQHDIQQIWKQWIALRPTCFASNRNSINCRKWVLRLTCLVLRHLSDLFISRFWLSHDMCLPVRQNPIQKPVKLSKKLCNYIILHNTT